MVKVYQHRFIKTMMISLTLILLVVLTLVNILNFYQLYQKVNHKADYLIQHDGKLPYFNETKKEIRNDTMFETRFFTVKYENGEISEVNTSHIASISRSEAEEYAFQIEWDPRGIINDYFYRTSGDEENGMIVFINIHNQMDAIQAVFVSSIWIALISLLILFIIVYFASKRAILPIVRGIEQQKRFITDAGHEIKTPLAIISANNEVLKMEIGENEWIKSSQNQIIRLNELVKKLLMLSKMEESREIEMTHVNMSKCLEKTLLEFRPLLDQKQVHLKKNIQKDVVVSADAACMQTLIDILLENALKYISEPFEISVSLSQHNRKCILEVYNSCEPFAGDPNLLFERFYRGDEAHSSNVSGQGIGLSIAKAIMDIHHGKISAQMFHNGILFKVEL